MGQAANSGRRASLDDKRLRAAGRVEQDPQLNPARDPNNEMPARGVTGGAFGRDEHAHRSTAPAGGGGAGMNRRPDAASADVGAGNPQGT